MSSAAELSQLQYKHARQRVAVALSNGDAYDPHAKAAAEILLDAGYIDLERIRNTSGGSWPEE